MGILVLGGSQATKVFAELLPNIFNNCKKNGVLLKIYQHCLPSQNDTLKSYYQNKDIEFEIFNFSNDILEYFSKVNLAITRSGSSVLAELTNANIPFISVPLPTSADNHQLKNALYYQKKKIILFLIEEVDLKDKLLPLIKNLSENKSLMNKIILNQRQHSDKNVYNNIDIALKRMINEKINLGQKEVIHFIGIGGIGMSGLAQIMKNMGFKIQGSDQTKNKNIISCLKAGIKIFIGHSIKNVKNATIIVKSSAIKNNNTELRFARLKRIPIYSRAEVLADVVSLKKI